MTTAANLIGRSAGECSRGDLKKATGIAAIDRRSTAAAYCHRMEVVIIATGCNSRRAVATTKDFTVTTSLQVFSS